MPKSAMIMMMTLAMRFITITYLMKKLGGDLLFVLF